MIMMKALALPILMLFYSGPVTMTSIDYIPGTDSLKVLVRLDYDLFLRDYQQTINDDIDLKVLRDYSPFPADMANNYINSKLVIIINKKLLIGKLLSTELTDSDISLNILYRPGKRIKNITVRNTILTGLYSDVENLTIIKINNLETGIKFTQEHNEVSFDLR
jgi:hypothetical protein